jgi:O-antigen/teichoic acid export membrane protein
MIETKGPRFHSAVEPAPPATRSLRLNFSWTLIGNMVYAGSQWGILLVLARSGSPETVGQFSLGLAVTAPVMLFAGLQLRTIQATDSRHLFRFGDYAGLRALMTAGAVGLILIFSSVAYRGDTARTVAAFAVSKGIESLSDVVYGLWQQQERMDLIAQSLMLRGVLALIAVAICFATSHAAWFSVCGMAAAWGMVFLGFDLRQPGVTEGKPWPHFSMPSLKQMLRLSLPLGIVTMLLSLSANIPRYAISHIQGVGELGIFAAVSYLFVAGGMVVNALGQSSLPRLAFYASQGRQRDFHRLTNHLMLIGAAVGIAGVIVAAVLGRDIIARLYGDVYARDLRLVIWLTVSATFGYMASFAGYALTAARHFRVQMPLFSFTALLSLGLCFVLVKHEGATGAAKAVAAVSLVQLVATVWLLRFLQPRQTRQVA